MKKEDNTNREKDDEVLAPPALRNAIVNTKKYKEFVKNAELRDINGNKAPLKGFVLFSILLVAVIAVTAIVFLTNCFGVGQITFFNSALKSLKKCLLFLLSFFVVSLAILFPPKNSLYYFVSLCGVLFLQDLQYLTISNLSVLHKKATFATGVNDDSKLLINCSIPDIQFA